MDDKEPKPSEATGGTCHYCGKPTTETVLWSKYPVEEYRYCCYECSHNVGGA